MKTNIRAFTSPDEMRSEILRVIPFKRLGSITNDALDAVVQAFKESDGNAGNGHTSHGTARIGSYFAQTNINTGEFDLYENVLI